MSHSQLTRVVLSMLLPAALAAGGARAEEAEPGAEAPVEAPAEPADEPLAEPTDEPLAEPTDEPAEDGEGFLHEFWRDPTLDGKLHLTYRARYIGKFHVFKDYHYPFPGGVSTLDEEHVRELKERREDFDDHDLDQYLAFRLEDLYAPGDDAPFLQKVDLESSFRYYKDIDGSAPGEESRNGFDRFSHRQTLQLYTLFTRLQTLDRHVELLLGRQYGYEAEWVHFDGGTAIARGMTLFGREVEIAGFGGVRAKFYPSSSSSRDGIAGGHVKTWLAEATRLKIADVYYVDNSLMAELRQDFLGWGWLALSYRQINEDPERVGLEAALDVPAWSLAAHLFYTGKLGRSADDFNFDYTQSPRRSTDRDKDRHFNIGDLAPYDELTLEARKGFLENYGVFAGGAVHRLRARDLEDNYNTDWQEVWGGLDISDSPWKGFSGRVTARYLHTDLPRRVFRLSEEEALDENPDFLPEDITGDGEPDFFGIELFAEQDFARKVAVGATVEFRSYDYQSNFAELENLNATSVGAHVRWRATRLTEWRLRYFYDRDYEILNPDLEAVHTVELTFQLRF